MACSLVWRHYSSITFRKCYWSDNNSKWCFQLRHDELFSVSKLQHMNMAEMWFQQDFAKCHTDQLEIRRYAFHDRLISNTKA